MLAWVKNILGETQMFSRNLSVSNQSLSVHRKWNIIYAN